MDGEGGGVGAVGFLGRGVHLLSPAREVLPVYEVLCEAGCVETRTPKAADLPGTVGIDVQREPVKPANQCRVWLVVPQFELRIILSTCMGSNGFVHPVHIPKSDQ